MRPEDKILKTYHELKKIRLYYNQIKEKSQLSDNTLSRTLKKLTEEKILKKEENKSNTYYQINDIKFVSIKFSEYDLKDFREINREIYIPLKEFLDELKLTITTVLFGSSSRKEEKENSDIDLLIIMEQFRDEKLQKKYENEIKKEIKRAKKKIEPRSNHPISIIYTNEKEFEGTKDNLIQMAKISGFPINNQQKYHEKRFKEYENRKIF
jgi:predicted nucleotidyltransferase